MNQMISRGKNNKHTHFSANMKQTSRCTKRGSTSPLHRLATLGHDNPTLF